MVTKAPIYPIGVQDFEDLRLNNNVYIDKTALIYKLASINKIYFLSRPHRFGKSLLISTLEAYFQGKRALFEGLAIAEHEKEWEAYPVLHIDFSMRKYFVAGALRELLNINLSRWEKMRPRTRMPHVLMNMIRLCWLATVMLFFKPNCADSYTGR